VTRPEGWTIEGEKATPLEDPVDDGLRQVRIMEHITPGGGRLVRGEDHGPLGEVPLVHDVVEDVGRVVPVAEVAHFVDHEDVHPGVAPQGLLEVAAAGCCRQLIDEGGGRGESRLEAILDGSVGDGNGKVGFPSAGAPVENEVPALGDEVGAEVAAQQSQAQLGLKLEVKVWG